MVSIISILAVSIPIISLILSILVNLYPKKSRQFLKSLNKKIKIIKQHLFTLNQSINYGSVLVGIILILIVPLGNEQTTIINQDSSIYIGSNPTCLANYNCFFPIQEDHISFFKVSLKADSINKLKIRYSSDEAQTLEVGFGSLGNYSYISNDLKATGNSFKYIEFFAGKKTEEICPTCFKNIIGKVFGSVFSSETFIVFKPSEGIRIQTIEFISEGSASNPYRIITVMVGVFYIVLGAIYLARFKNNIWY